MDRFQQMRVFVAVAQEQSFAAAARRLQQSAPVVTRAIAALETRLGVRLLHRTTRRVRMTEAGERYLEDARRILAEVETAEEAAAGINAEPSGLLQVTAPVLFGRHYVTPGVTEYLRRYPQMQVQALFVDRTVNLLEEGIDVAVRIGELPDSGMRALQVGTVRQLVVAAPGYLAERGEPRAPQELAQHTLIASTAGNFAANWRFSFAEGDKPVRLRPRFSVNTNDAAIRAAVDGFGITRVLSYQAAQALAAGDLDIILRDYESAPLPIHIVHREGQHSTGKVRAFIDLMAERLRADAMLNS
jgi:DNA-binding transcriptional LysR family regulator